jgi:hypothetical protein
VFVASKYGLLLISLSTLNANSWLASDETPFKLIARKLMFNLSTTCCTDSFDSVVAVTFAFLGLGTLWLGTAFCA